ncbi:MAG: polysaccharide biosynthesis protein [Bacteroidales bacterium]|nr:polysaccharide biosynthesis protein [Bacteroidales bacterium]
MPRWLIFLIDISIVCLSVALAYLLRFNFNIPDNEMGNLPAVVGIVAVVRTISFLIAKTNAGIIRYTSTEDAIRIVVVILAGSLFFSGANLISYYFFTGRHIIPFSIIIIEFITVIFAMVTYRVVVKMAYLELINPSAARTKVIIYGAGEAGIITKRTLDRDAGSKNKVIAFIDDDASKHGKKLEGVTIYSRNRLFSLLKEEVVDNVIVAIQNLPPVKKQEITDICLEAGVRVLTVPPVVNWINGELSFRQIRQMRIEDLLERDPIKLDREKMQQELNGKKVLITGASGSIGSELARQILEFRPAGLILVDQAESGLFDLDIELSEKDNEGLHKIVVADIRNLMRMEHIFKMYQPEIIFHAAAYKHVPIMENNPAEALLTNIRGTKNIADLAMKYEAAKFIMISTDKAVNPTNVMGASKRIAEIYIQALNKTSGTRFITTRFGNVLGSNGSAVTIFRKQIERGGPITVTHPEVTRFFMTIPEACQLVLEAGAMGKGGEIFLFDMGRPVKITELATKMIRLAGLEPEKDIKIKFTGLRPGEKLYEELLNDGENSMPTHHPRILIGKVREYEPDTVSKEIEELVSLFTGMDENAIVGKMKRIVPEFISKNSVFEELDNLSA